jgi:hypothetical protein
MVPEKSELDAPEVYAVYLDGPLLGIIKPSQQVDDGGLACARGAEYGETLPRMGVERDIVENLLPIDVTESNTLETDVPLNVL